MRANAVGLAVRTDGAIAAVGNDVRQALGLHAEVIVGERTQPTPTKMRHQFAPGSPSLELRIFPDIANLLEIFFVPGSGASHGEGRGIDSVGKAKELCDVAIERNVRRRVFKAGLAVHQHAELVEQVAGTFTSHAKPFFAPDISDPLALLAVWLEILFEGDDAIGSQARDFMLGDFVAGEFVVVGSAAVEEWSGGG